MKIVRAGASVTAGFVSNRFYRSRYDRIDTQLTKFDARVSWVAAIDTVDDTGFAGLRE
jgi:hypothetical protein